MGTDDATESLRGDRPHGVGVGTRIGRYTLVRFLGRGGMGEVYETRRDNWHVRYAVKVVDHRLVANEAEVQQHVQHPNVISIEDAGTFVDDAGTTHGYIVMELVRRALSITTFADQRRLDTFQRIELFLDACHAVEAIHRKAVHFDLKPENILVDEGGNVKVGDLGLARLATDLDIARPGGSWTYMCPEQMELPIADLDGRCDQYALGATLFELLTGRPPHFIGRGASRDDIRRIKHEAPPSLVTACSAADEHLQRIVEKSLDVTPTMRYETVAAFRGSLESWLNRRRTPAGRLRATWKRHAVPRALCLAFGIGIFGALVSGFVLTPIVAPLVDWERRVPARAGAALAELTHVRVVPIPPPEEIEQLARDCGIDGVTASNIFSWRRIYARLCERLAGVARTVVFDLRFPSADEADEAFSAGIARAVASGTPIVVGSRSRTVDAKGRPDVSPALWLAGVQWGYITLDADEQLQPLVPLLARDIDGRTYPSLSLAAAGLALGQDGTPEYTLGADERIAVNYSKPIEGRPDLRQPLRQHGVIHPSFVQPLRLSAGIGYAERGFQLDDMIAYLQTQAPAASQRDRATLDMKSCFLDDTIEQFRDKVVVVYNPQLDTAMAAAADGPAHVVYVHASAIESLLAHRTTRLWGEWQHIAPMLALGMIGAGVALGITGVTRRVLPAPVRRFNVWAAAAPVRWLACAGVGLLAWFAALVLANRYDVLMSPAPSIGSLLASCELGAVAFACFATPTNDMKGSRA